MRRFRDLLGFHFAAGLRLLQAEHPVAVILLFRLDLVGNHPANQLAG
jgi:hypothetical protein